MSHGIDRTKTGWSRFAYNDREIPWHRLGTPIKGYGTLEQMLSAAHADYDVVLTKVAAVDDSGELIRNADGTAIIIPDGRATMRQNHDGSFDPLATVGTRYEVRQNKEVLERALAVVNASGGDAVIDTCGVLKGGSRFFATIDLGRLDVSSADGVDSLARYLVISAGHDGVWPIRYANTEVRAVCNNTVVLGEQQAKRVFTARHTRNVDSIIQDAREVMNIAVTWRSEVENSINALISRNNPTRSMPDKILAAVQPKKKGESKREREHRESIWDLLCKIYLSDRNSGGFGHNAWSVYNSACEYLDHYRHTSAEELAMASMDESSVATKKKLFVEKVLLS